MKSITLMFALLVTFMLSACGQSNAPEQVKVAFAKKFPAAKHVKWGKESEQEWEAEFSINGIEYSASFDNSGKWLETESEIGKKALPDNIMNTLEKKFNLYKIDEAEISESAEGVFYEIKLENKKENIEVIFDKNGDVIRQKNIREDEEDND